MLSLQGEFANRAAAEAAVQRLTEAGIARHCIRVWNIIPDQPSSGGSDSAAGGAVVGGLIGGAVGLGLGAALGDAYNSPSHLPAPSGVRVVVDYEPGDADVAALLREAGASGVRQNLK